MNTRAASILLIGCFWCLSPTLAEHKEQVLSEFRNIASDSSVQEIDIAPDDRALAITTSRIEKGSTSDSLSELIDQVEIKNLTDGKTLIKKVISRESMTLNEILHKGLTSHLYPRFTDDGKILVVCDRRGSIHLLHSDSLEEIRRISLDIQGGSANWGVKAVEIANGRIAVLLSWGFKGGALRVYELNSGRLNREWNFHDCTVSSIAWRPDGQKLAVTLVSNSINSVKTPKYTADLEILDVETGNEKLINSGGVAGPVAYGKEDKLYTAAFHPSADNRDPIRVLDAMSGNVIREIDDSPSGVRYHLGISRDGKTLMGYIGREKSFFNIRTLEQDHKYLDQRFRIWDAESGSVVATSPMLQPLKPSDFSVRLSATGRYTVVWFRGSLDSVLVFRVP